MRRAAAEILQQAIKDESERRALPLNSLCGIYTEISKLLLVGSGNYKCPRVLSEQHI